MPGKFSGKTVIVTGGISGIGAAIAELVAAEGGQVIAADINCTAIEAAEGRIIQSHVDVSDQTSVRRLMEDVLARFGKLDAVIHSAGTGEEKPFLETRVEDLERVLKINLVGSFIVSQEAAKAMLPRKQGAIVHIASVSGMIGNGGRSAYGSSKAGLIGLTRILAAELAQHNIRVNAVSPGPVETPLVSRTHSKETRADWNARTALGRYATTDEVAPAAAFLASDDASYITGQILAVDGGFLIRGIGIKQ